MAAIQPSPPRTAEHSGAASENDIEKTNGGQNVVDIHADADLKVDDSASEHKQAGVKQVEAITSVWSKTMLWIVFVLYVSSSPNYFANKGTLTT